MLNAEKQNRRNQIACALRVRAEAAGHSTFGRFYAMSPGAAERVRAEVEADAVSGLLPQWTPMAADDAVLMAAAECVFFAAEYESGLIASMD